MPKVLLVEDDNNLREIYEARLQAEGYEISSAQDGEQALVVAKEFQPDLIISDVMMPKISGFEMLDILRNTEGLKNTRVIMLTALGQAEDKSRADSLGADRYLVKSQVTLEDIVTSAHQLLDDPVAAPPITPTSAEATSASTAAPFPPADDSPLSPPTTPVTTPDTPAIAVATEPTAAPDELPAPISTQPGAVPASETTNSDTASTATMAVAEPPTEPSEPAPAVATEPAQPAPEENSPVTATSTPTAAPVVVAPETATSEASDFVIPDVQAAPNSPIVSPDPNPTDNAATPAAEPVQEVPVVTPTVEPAAVPVSAAETPAQTDGADMSNIETSTVATEQASVNQQIEDFIKNTDEAPAVPQQSSSQTADDQLMASALDDLAKSAPSTVEPTAPEASAPPVVTSDQPADSDTVGVSHKKVIQPLESAPKPDLDDLLAREAALEAASNQAASVTGDAAGPTETPPALPHQPGDEFTPQGDAQPTPPKRPDGFDPNNIAL